VGGWLPTRLVSALTGLTLGLVLLWGAGPFVSPAYAALPEIDFDSLESQVIIRTEETTVSESWTLVVAEFDAKADYEDFNVEGTPYWISNVFTFYEGDGWDSGNPTYLAVTDLTSTRKPWVAFQAISGTDLQASNFFAGSNSAFENPNYQATTQPVKLSVSEREKLASAIASELAGVSGGSTVTSGVVETTPAGLSPDVIIAGATVVSLAMGWGWHRALFG